MLFWSGPWVHDKDRRPENHTYSAREEMILAVCGGGVGGGEGTDI